jgi:hypothetical protein
MCMAKIKCAGCVCGSWRTVVVYLLKETAIGKHMPYAFSWPLIALLERRGMPERERERANIFSNMLCQIHQSGKTKQNFNISSGFCCFL